MKKIVQVASFSLFLALAAVLSAQTTGRISGLVTDPAGGAVPGASIHIVNESNRLEWTASTTSAAIT